MHDQMYRNKILKVRLNNGSLSSRSRWKEIEDSSFSFPQMSFGEMGQLFFGTYQSQTGHVYVEEHMNNDDDYIIEVDTSNDNIACTYIHSRHSSTSVYKAWIQYSFTDDPMQAWYCQCTAGAHTIEGCSHVDSVVWYLTFARYSNFKPTVDRRKLLQVLPTHDEENETSSGAESSSEEG